MRKKTKSSRMISIAALSPPESKTPRLQENKTTAKEKRMQRRTVFAREQRLPLQHLRKDTSRAPDIDRDVILLPGEHDLRRAVVPCRDVARHLRVLYSGKAKVTNFQITILVHEDVARFLRRRREKSGNTKRVSKRYRLGRKNITYEITMDDTGRVHVFQATLYIKRSASHSTRQSKP